MSVAFLVDGLTEQRFVQLVCSRATVQRINLNGDSVRVEALAKRLASLIRLWNGRYRSVIVIVDREKRDQSADDFADELLAALNKEGAAAGVVVGVADRMIENWMLGDSSVWPGAELPESVDGFSGATAIKRLTESRYDKAAHGPEYLRRVRCSELRKKSPSFSRLSDRLNHLKCHWLSK